MAEIIECLNILSEKLAKLDGVGRKSAVKMAYSILEMPKEEVDALSNAIIDAKEKVHLCPLCQNFTDKEICSICDDPKRDNSIICVVNDFRTISVMEKVREFHGVYHVLHGLISPLNGMSPDKIKLKELLMRIQNTDVKEVIVATDPTVEGEATAMYIAHLLNPLDIKVTRPATGIPMGADLEFADAVTLSRAMEARTEVK